MLGDLPEPWCRLPDECQRRFVEDELKKELGAGHPLAGLPLSVIARREDQDDVLVSLDRGEVAEVHLTWSGKMETDPRWPRAVIFESMEQWLVQQASSPRE
jgi:hypothetical protein